MPLPREQWFMASRLRKRWRDLAITLVSTFVVMSWQDRFLGVCMTQVPAQVPRSPVPENFAPVESTATGTAQGLSVTNLLPDFYHIRSTVGAAALDAIRYANTFLNLNYIDLHDSEQGPSHGPHHNLEHFVTFTGAAEAETDEQPARPSRNPVTDEERNAFNAATQNLGAADRQRAEETFARLDGQQRRQFLQLSPELRANFIALERRVSEMQPYNEEQIRGLNLGTLSPLEARELRAPITDQDRSNLRDMAMSLVRDPTQLRSLMNDLRGNFSVEQMQRYMCQLGSVLQGSGLQTFLGNIRNDDGTLRLARMGIGVAGQNEYMLFSSNTRQEPVVVELLQGGIINVVRNDSRDLAGQVRQRLGQRQ